MLSNAFHANHLILGDLGPDFGASKCKLLLGLFKLNQGRK